MAQGTIVKAYRGPAASLPTLEAGQLGFTTDTEILYIGDGVTNHAVLMGSQATAAGLALMDDANAAAQLVTLGAAALAGATFTGAVESADHGTAATDQVVNVCYGTGDPPTANTTTEGALFIKYTA